MAYRSTVETAEAWGVSVARIAVLIRKGRIPGAKLVGRTWLIPTDAEKPSDMRRRAVRAAAAAKGAPRRYPILFRPSPEDYEPPLTEEELRLRSVEQAAFACRFDEANDLMGDLPETATALHVRIGALYMEGILGCMLCEPERVFHARCTLALLIEGEPDAAPEIRPFAFELDCFLGQSAGDDEAHRMDLTHSYPEGYPELLYSQDVYRRMIRDVGGIPEREPVSDEIACRMCEAQGNWPEAQAIHLYLIPPLLKRREPKRAELHLREAVRLAEAHHAYLIPAVILYYLGPYLQNALPAFSEPDVCKMLRLSEEIHARYVRYSEVAGQRTLFGNLKQRDLCYVCYAAMGYANKEIADRLSCSESTVANRYYELYSLLGVSGKRGLRELYNESIACSSSANRKGNAD